MVIRLISIFSTQLLSTGFLPLLCHSSILYSIRSARARAALSRYSFLSLYLRHLRYNFLPTAGSSLGYKHTEDALAKMSEAKSGTNHPMYGKSGALNPMYGKVPANAFESGANNPMYGKVSANAMTINVYSPDGKLIQSFSSQVAAANWLGVSNVTVHNYIKSGKVFNNLYRFENSGSK
jgi:group I intron endonuclease